MFRPAATHRPHAQAILALCCVNALAGHAACSRSTEPPPFLALHGTVHTVRVEEGEVLLRVRDPRTDQDADQSLLCALSRDVAEIYIQDKLCTLADVKTGDRVEFIGNYDPGAPSERFVVTLALIAERPAATTQPSADSSDSSNQTPSTP